MFLNFIIILMFESVQCQHTELSGINYAGQVSLLRERSGDNLCADRERTCPAHFHDDPFYSINIINCCTSLNERGANAYV